MKLSHWAKAAQSRFAHHCGAMLLAGLATLPGVASAAWETLSAPRHPDSNCGAPHDTAPTLRRSDNRPLLVRNGTTTRLEVYGHGLDLVPTADIAGGINGSARRVGGHAGAVNAARFCGAIGSLVVEISIPREAANGTRGTLDLGGERIALEVRRAQVLTRWSDDNDSSTLDAQTQAQRDAANQASADASRANLGACQADCGTRRAACDAARPAIEAARAAACVNTNCVSFLRSCAEQQTQCTINCSNNVLSFASLARQDTAARCLRDLGGQSSVLADGSLEIWLPDVSRDRLATCMGKAWFAPSAIERAQGVVGNGFGQAFGVTDGLPSTLRASSGDWSGAPSDASGLLRLSLGPVRTLVGRLEGVVRVEAASGSIPVEAGSLRYRVYTTPSNGVKRLTPSLAVVRQAGPINVAVETHLPLAQASIGAGLSSPVAPVRPTGTVPQLVTRAGAARGNLSWALSPQSGLAVDRCFDAASGSAQIATGSSRGAIELPAKASSACDGASFTLEAWLGTTRPQAGAPFVASVAVGMGRMMAAPAPSTSPTPRPAIEVIRRP